MRYWLEITGSDGHTLHFALDRAVTVIGRSAECDIQVPLRSVEHHHCRIEWRGGTRLTLEEMHATGGTLVNGRAVRSTGLRAGDCVMIGPVRFVVCTVADGDRESTPPPSPEMLNGTTTPIAPGPGEGKASRRNDSRER